VLFGDAHNGYTIAYVFAIDDPEARGGKREGRRWYAFLALFEGEAEATASWPWVTSGFEQMATGLRERANKHNKESSPELAAKGDANMRDDIEQGGVFVQSLSLEERTPSHIRATRGSFGHPEGYIRRPRFGNPGGTGGLTAATVKTLAELIGLESVDVEIHAAMGWIMSGLLGPGRGFSVERPSMLETETTEPEE